MDKYMDFEIEVGEEVNVYDIDQTPLGVGIYKGKTISEGYDTIEIELDGKTIYGFECWWRPVKDCKEGDE